MNITDFLKSYPDDVFLYYGAISRKGYNQLSDALDERQTKKAGCCLILCTGGGDPDAGYRIARALRHHYERLEVLIPDRCKSAGTLICIGANRLIFGDRGELGPLDVQLSKPDEMFESMSGLDLIQALGAIENKVLTSFTKYLLDIRTGSRLRTKMAADMAAKLTQDFMAPITAKIDPVTLGEHQRAMQIGLLYGERLSQMSGNLKEGAIETLVGEYPSHGFVIDRKEARELFINVDSPNDSTRKLVTFSRRLLEKDKEPGTLLVVDLAKICTQEQPDERTQNQPSSAIKGSDSGAGASGPTNPEGGSAEPTPTAPNPEGLPESGGVPTVDKGRAS